MNTELQVVRDRDGVMRDIYQRPMVIIFDTKQGRRRLPPNISASQAAHNRKSSVEISSQLGKRLENVQPLEFINVSSCGQNPKKTQTAIKTHVMRDYRRRERQQKQQNRQRQPVNQPPCPVPVGSEKTDSLSRQSMIPPQPLRTLEPSTNYPIQMQPHLFHLAHYYISVVEDAPCYQKKIGWRPKPAGPGLFALAMTDAALFYMVLCCSAVYRDVSNRKSESSDRLFYMTKSIQLINKRLDNSPTGVPDAIIAAVALLAIAECSAGDYATWALHMEGLSRMVEIRGGITTLCASLQREIYMADFMGCMETDSHPRHPLPNTYSLSSHTAITESIFQNACGGFQDISIICSLDAELLKILNDVQRSIAAIVQTQPDDLGTVQQGPDQIITLLRYRLLSYTAPNKESALSQIVAKMCRLGALLFIKTIPQLPSFGYTHRKFIENLKAALTRINLYNTGQNRQLAEFFLWLMFVSGIVAVDITNRKWCLAQLFKFSMVLRLRTWKDVKLVLRKFLWVEAVNEDIFLSLWRDRVHDIDIPPHKMQ